MKKLSLSGFDIDNIEKIDAYDKLLDFINHNLNLKRENLRLSLDF